MKIEQFTVETYLGPNQHFSFARKTLPAGVPDFAHTHDYYEVFLVERGKMRHWINGHVEVLDRGSLVFMRPNDSHALSAVDGTPCQIINIVFARETANHLVDRYGEEFDGLFFWTIRENPETYLLRGARFERAVNISQELQTAHRSLARIEEYLLSLMTRVVDIPIEASQSIPPWLLKACTQARMPEVFRGGPAAFVRAAGRGHEHVSRVTKEHLGVTPSQYINRLRMEHAALLLSSDDRPVPLVAEDCGIENLSHFYKVFRAQYGVTPRRYRQIHARTPV